MGNSAGDERQDDSAEHGFPIADELIVEPADDQPEPPPERELTAMEMMDAPARASEQTRRTVLWMAFSFMFALFALTIGVIVAYGLDPLTVVTLAILGMACYALFGALRYKGEDPMAQFDPPPLPKRRLGLRRRERMTPERRPSSRSDSTVDSGADPDVDRDVDPRK
ncbi:MAG: hypothetical protein WAP35_10390 [Solirubrobacterales bacterium]